MAPTGVHCYSMRLHLLARKNKGGFMDIPEILNIGRRRERAVYYRKDGAPTMPLPADPYSKAYYLGKGFTLKPAVTEQEGDTIKCPICEFEARNAFGLSSHLRKHTNEKKEEK